MVVYTTVFMRKLVIIILAGCVYIKDFTVVKARDDGNAGILRV